MHGLLVEKSRSKETLEAQAAEQEAQRQLRKAAPAAVAVAAAIHQAAVVTHQAVGHHQVADHHQVAVLRRAAAHHPETIHLQIVMNP